MALPYGNMNMNPFALQQQMQQLEQQRAMLQQQMQGGMNMMNMNKIKAIHPGRVVAEPGIITAELDRLTKEHSGQELRFHPSTTGTATLAGFIAGGSGGVGSITWGGLRDLGNILRLRVVTLEAEPRVLELSA